MIEPTTALRTRAALCAAAILAAGVLAGPALACQNPSFAGAPVARDATSPPSFDEATDALGLATPAVYSLPATGDGVGTIVGMWHAILRIGNDDGPVFDEVLEHFHADGTELIISNGLPPALGNVCIGVWKRIGLRTFKLKHMTWNWSSDVGGFGVPGTFAGHFVLEMTLRIDGSGNGFTGHWTARNFGLDGEHLPNLDAEGVVKGVRITVN
jgi:hypothetical protein